MNVRPSQMPGMDCAENAVDMTRAFWLFVNIGMSVFLLCFGYSAMAPGKYHDGYFDWKFGLIMVIFAWFMAFALVLKTAPNKMQRPSWTRNPFSWRLGPLQRIFFINCWAGAGTLGMGAGLVLISRDRFGHFCDWLCFTLGLLFAQIVIYTRFRDRIENKLGQR